MKRLLVYDPSCPFCVGLAKKLAQSYEIDILPNDSKELPEFVNKEAVKRDVHFFWQYRNSNLAVISYSGALAAIEILSIKHPFFATLCRLPLVKQAIKGLYFIVKKSRKYL